MLVACHTLASLSDHADLRSGGLDVLSATLRKTRMVHSHLWEELQVKEMLNYGSDNLLGTGHMSTLG